MSEMNVMDWGPHKVISALHSKGTSLRKLSIQHGYATSGALTAALRKPYPKSERIIAGALDLEPEEIWPVRYKRRKERFESIYGAEAEMA